MSGENRSPKAEKMKVTPIYSHDRTIISTIVLIAGTVLLWHFGDSTPIVALVTSAWTLTLTFWFRIAVSPNGGSQ
jgi:hypothetical protein